MSDMRDRFEGWEAVARHLNAYADEQQALEADPASGDSYLNAGQQASLRALAQRLPLNGVVIADEVGMGKTRIAVALARAVTFCGGRVAVLAPPGLGFQWREELRQGSVKTQPMLRSLKSFLAAWPTEGDTQPKPWFLEDTVLISHAFTNWRLGQGTAPWRWALLPEIYAHWRKRNTQRQPRDYLRSEALQTAGLSRAAQSICDAIPNDESNVAWQQCAALSDNTPWPAALDDAQYSRNSALRPWLECAVGLGLGMFDLVIVDEAHKSRGEMSRLSSLLNSVIQRNKSARVVAMTATPVELDVSQWQQTLSRVDVDINTPPAMKDSINAYAVAVQRVRASPSSPEARHSYAEAAKNFQAALSPYLLRRDKREDPAVMAFQRYSKLPFNAYRQEDSISIVTAGLSPAWRQAVCAAEAMSVITRQAQETHQTQRLRLTIGNGHGIAALLNPMTAQEEAALLKDDADEGAGTAESDTPDATTQLTTAEPDTKAAQRKRWWLNTMGQAFAGGDSCLFDHPAILACVQAIEESTASGEKVLVFGRFTQPLQALVHLLNAREMLRCLEDNRHWPQSTVRNDMSTHSAHGERAAVVAALRQLKSPLTLTEVDKALDDQYAALEALRKQRRASLLGDLAVGLGMADEARQPSERSDVQQLFVTFQQSAQRAAEAPQDDRHVLALVSKALYELMGNPEAATPAQIADAFEQLVDALTDQGESDQNGDDKMDASEAQALWPALEERLLSDFNRRQGVFAQLMFGGTTPESRRMMQLAFNRPHSFPKVLVAQSMVGREGLNLHKACSTVILLHPEWNPGIVEQQIGRVDRVGSHWSKRLADAIQNQVSPEDLPRIRVRAVVFQGTYDEHNWQVLHDRWDDLRAQLHGVVIPPRQYAKDPALQPQAEELQAVAPRFSPTPRATQPDTPRATMALSPSE